MGLKVLGLIMAGGKGERLYPLTRDRAKPAVPFGGHYRIADFVISNFVNSGILSLYVLTQFKSQSLTEHIRATWRFGSVLRDQFVVTVPAQMQRGETWYRGTADAVRQNINLVCQSEPDLVAVFGADHIYRMDIRQMVEYHLEKGADITISALPVPRGEARDFGTIRVDGDWRVRGFKEKVPRPPPMPGDRSRTLASMGNYLFSTSAMLDILGDKPRQREWIDFGRDILPRVCKKLAVFAYDFNRNVIPGMLKGEQNYYWRDVGTIEAYYNANMELKSVAPPLNLYNPQWPILTAEASSPPVKFVFNEEQRRGFAADSIISPGTIISGGRVIDCVLGHNVRIHSWSEVRESILLGEVDIGRRCRVRRAIIDKNVSLPPDTVIGYHPAEDKKRFFVSPTGIVVIPREPYHLHLHELNR